MQVFGSVETSEIKTVKYFKLKYTYSIQITLLAAAFPVAVRLRHSQKFVCYHLVGFIELCSDSHMQ